MKAVALPGQVLVDDIKRGERKIGNILLQNDDGKQDGIRPRWAHIYAVGEGVTDVKVDEWVLVVHGQWTRAVELTDADNKPYKIWKINYPDAALAASDKPEFETFSGESIITSEKLDMPA